ncbi:MarR family winged helix-turn-helix transcriptional regulator [Paenibacillus tyrfis]|uniref:MarR family transcriptional regulator n=1 Tax=Paenibacillus tyrfis TaxID=1501230 RepID=A0A081NYW1_9BACL|nr:MarR family transcriptional regulator [Paenibacillus tyrfis]KEQ23634.1 MarR family transcriptional regulator [Paenibacillus tyrfis]
MLDNYFKGCLYFSANRLSRLITKMAEEEFSPTGLSPTYAFILMAVYEKEGISQKELAEIVHLHQSTITRLIEKLVGKGFLTNQTSGRTSLFFSTDKGKQLQDIIETCWGNLHKRYAEILGQEKGDALTLELYETSDLLEDHLKS